MRAGNHSGFDASHRPDDYTIERTAARNETNSVAVGTLRFAHPTAPKGKITWTPRPRKTCIFMSRRNGHGLKHDPFNAIIAPRPIGWISSRDTKGNVNLAPYSFFNAFCYVPPLIGFSSTYWKDSVQNIQETGVFVGISRPWIWRNR